MNNIEAIEVLTNKSVSVSTSSPDSKYWEKLRPAMDLAIKALVENEKLKKENDELKARLSMSVELPCKQFETLYTIYNDEIQKYKVLNFIVYSQRVVATLYEMKTTLKTYVDLNDLGQTVFLTKEEAEQALKNCETISYEEVK